jgi:Flp pilus assembly protein TadD
MTATNHDSKRSLSRIAAAALLMLAAYCACAQTHTTVRHHKATTVDQPAELAQAEDAIQKNDFPTAETLLKKALAADPKNYQAWFDMGFVCNRLGRTADSIHAYRQSVAAKPDVFESNLNLGLMLARGNSPEAETFLRAAAALKPTDHVEEGQARAWLSLGHILETAKPQEAIDAFKKAAALTPKDPEPHLSAGLILERQKDFAAAEAEYKQALVLDPRSSDAAIGLTNLYMKSGRLNEAEPLLRRLAAERPDDAGLHLQLGRVLAAEDDKTKKDEAVAEFQAALKLSPNDIPAQRELADLLAAAGKNDQAEAAYRPLVAAQPNDPELRRALGRALLLQKKFAEAQQELLTAVRLKRDAPDAYVDLAFAASENKDYELTVRALNGRAMLPAEMPAICYFLRASAYDHLRDFQLASADYHLFLDAAQGKYPDQEWQARHRLIAIEPKKH